MAYSFINIANSPEQVKVELEEPFKFKNAPLVLGVAIYSFEGIGILLTIKNSMEFPKKFYKYFKCDCYKF